MKRTILLLMIWMLSISLIAEELPGINYLAGEMDYLEDPPLKLISRGERLIILFPRGYLNLTRDLKLDGQSLLSLWISYNEDFPLLADGWFIHGNWVFLDQSNQLYRQEGLTGSLESLYPLPRQFQRALLLSEKQLVAYSQQGWSYWEYKKNQAQPGWQQQNRYSMSPMSLLIRGEQDFWFYDPLSRILKNNRMEGLKLNPSPSGLINHGEILRGELFLWDNQHCSVYHVSDGTLLRELDLQDGSYSIYSAGDRRLYQYHYPTGALKAYETEEILQFSLSREDWRNWMINLVNLYLDDSSWEEKMDERFYSWLYQQLLQDYLKHPLDREMGQSVNKLEMKLKEKRTNLY